MTFTFTPKTEEELTLMNLLPEGEYHFIVQRAQEKTSKNGNPMLELFLEVFSPDGDSVFVADYLVDKKKMAWKIKHFCDSIRLEARYNQGQLDPHILAKKEGIAHIAIEKSENYKPKNKVKDYIIKKEKKNVSLDQPLGKADSPLEIIDDTVSIPF